MQLTSNAFEHEGRIPDQYTYNGGNKCPPLSWNDAPEDTKSFALIVDDPDAPSGVFTHWVAFNIPANQNGIEENDAGQFAQGENDFGEIGYGGPRPPEGHGPHRYYFKLYALDTPLDAEPGIDKGALLGIMENHILDKAELMGKYEIKGEANG